MTLNRRGFVKQASLLAGAYATAGFLPLLLKESHAESLDQPFQVPEQALGQRSGDRVLFDLTLRSGISAFFPGVSTPSLGINAHFLGPTLRVKRGDKVTLKVTNQIGRASVLHWHGFTLPAVADGGPHQSIPDGGSWQPSFEVRQDAATFWYHSHQMHETGEQVYRGLAGMFIIDDVYSQGLSLPNDYGVDDIPVVIQDRNFSADGAFRYIHTPMDRMMGVHGEVMLINGVYRPRLQAQRSLIRFRLLNGSNARSYRLAFSDGRAFQVIAGDGGFLPQAVMVTELPLSPGERAEILVDVSDRQPVALISRGTPRHAENLMGKASGQVMQLKGRNHSMHLFWIDSRQAEDTENRMLSGVLLPRVKPIEPLLNTRPMVLDMGPMGMGRRVMRRMKQGMSGAIGPSLMGDMNIDDMMRGQFTINDRSMDIDRIDFSVKRDSTEIWVIRNASAMAHPFHVHNTQFYILKRSGRTLLPHERGLKDTVMVSPGEQVRILLPFRYYSNSEVPYMYHCHILEHEDGGMMGQFVVDA